MDWASLLHKWLSCLILHLSVAVYHAAVSALAWADSSASPKIRGAWGGSHDPNLKLANFKICRDASYIVSNFSQWIFYYDFIFKNLFLEKKERLKFHSSCEVWILPSQNNPLTNQNAYFKKEQAASFILDKRCLHTYINIKIHLFQSCF